MAKIVSSDLNPANANMSPFCCDPPVLRSECAADFVALLKAFNHEIMPRGIVEDMYVSDLACLVWEMLRLRRCKTALINVAFSDAVAALFEMVTKAPGVEIDFVARERAQAIATAWFIKEQNRTKILQTLEQKFELDESAVEAEAIRRSARDLEVLDRMLIGL